MLRAEHVQLMAELGFRALTFGHDADAERIFQGLAAARPRHEAGAVGLAVLALKRGRPDTAIGLLKDFTDSERALTFLGLAYLRAGDTERATRILNGAVMLGETGLARELLRAIAGEAPEAG